MSGGPIPPPPLAWHPEQLYQPNSRCPSETAYALSSYGPFTCDVSCIVPGCKELTRTLLGVVLGGFSRKRRCSRSHAPIVVTNASAMAQNAIVRGVTTYRIGVALMAARTR